MESREMMDEMVDVERLRAEIREESARIVTLKRALRTTWTRPMAEEQRQHCRLRRRITELCILRAYLRGRYHLRKPLRDGSYPGMAWDQESYHRQVAARVATAFARQDAQTEVRP